MKRSKNYRAAAELVTPGKVYAPLEAVRVAKQTAKAELKRASDDVKR